MPPTRRLRLVPPAAREPSRDRPALLEAAESLADMGRRVLANGPEPVYAREKFAHALFKAAEGLALCGVTDVDEVLAELRRGFARGLWLAGRR
jgi:hypothetical protein